MEGGGWKSGARVFFYIFYSVQLLKRDIERGRVATNTFCLETSSPTFPFLLNFACSFLFSRTTRADLFNLRQVIVFQLIERLDRYCRYVLQRCHPFQEGKTIKSLVSGACREANDQSDDHGYQYCQERL